VWLVILAVSLGACRLIEPVSEPSPTVVDVTDEELRSVSSIWINQLGLVQDDLDVWRARLTEACSQGIWDEAVAVGLASQYVAEDQDDKPVSEEFGSPSVQQAADALWLMAAQVCRDRFPAGTIEEGPPFTNLEQ
jgi:hypothetical protein